MGQKGLRGEGAEVLIWLVDASGGKTGRKGFIRILSKDIIRKKYFKGYYQKKISSKDIFRKGYYQKRILSERDIIKGRQ